MPGHDAPYSIGSNHWPGLSKLTEEMGELQQVIGKILALGHAGDHWDGTNLTERLTEEIADVWAALGFVIRHNLNSEIVGPRMRAKLDLFEQWHKDQGRA